MGERVNTRQKLLTKQNAISGAKTTGKVGIPTLFGGLVQKIGVDKFDFDIADYLGEGFAYHVGNIMPAIQNAVDGVIANTADYVRQDPVISLATLMATTAILGYSVKKGYIQDGIGGLYNKVMSLAE